jgi:type I restriction enzyme R subunit
MNSNPMGEKPFQAHILRSLGANGYEVGSDAQVDRSSGVYTGAFARFVQKTQPYAWDYFVSNYGSEANAAIELDLLLKKTLKVNGTLAALRDGIPNEGSRPAIKVMYAKPGRGKKDPNWANYKQNIFTIAEEVHFEDIPGATLRLDLVGWINGVAVFTAELKNELTGQSHRRAENQYKKTRSPHWPMLKPGTGALVHFAIGNAEASFTTSLEGRKTKFYPFNTGFANGAGNDPSRTDSLGYRTYYIWEEVWSTDNWADLLWNFIHIEYQEGEDKNSPTAGVLIYPRYQQYDFLRQVKIDLIQGENPVEAGKPERVYKRGSSFLVQHSAGSGKTKTIASLAHQLASLHSDDGELLYDLVIVLNDRLVVDSQLRAAVDDMSRHKNQVGIVDKNSKQLAGYLSGPDARRIVVCTIQKFAYIKDLIDQASSKLKSIAVIGDEAHSGQTGSNASNVIDVLDGLSLIDEIAEDSSFLKKNVTFFGFTATPRKETLEKFAPEGKPYHLYSMRQAIEEGHILNPLENWVSHEIVNRISFHGENTVIESSTEGKKALRGKVRVSSENLTYKVKVTLEHMVNSTLKKMGGEGKGMVTVSSRAEVLMWLNEIQRLQAENPGLYDAVKPIVAYTGSLDTDSHTQVTEEDLNGFPSTEIPTRLRSAAFNLLIVANKYQTGFDENRLCAMYIDRTLKDVMAVQTLSRLNRLRDGKTTSVIDFANNAENVRAAFAEYQVESTITTPRVVTHEDLLATARQIYAYGLFSEKNTADYAIARHRANKNAEDSDAIKQARDIVLAIADTATRLRARDLVRLDLFKSTAKEFISDYVFYSQFARVSDKRLKDLRLLLSIALLQVNEPSFTDAEWVDQIDIEMTTAEIRQEDFSGLDDIERQAEEVGTSKSGSPRALDKPTTLAEIVEEWNEHFSNLFYRSPALTQSRRDRGAPETTTQTSAEWAGQSSQYNEILKRVAEGIAAKDSIRNRALGKSFDRFNNAEAFAQAEKLVLPIIASLSREFPEARDIIAAYSNEPEVRHEIVNFALVWAYQQVTNQTIAASTTTN